MVKHLQKRWVRTMSLFMVLVLCLGMVPAHAWVADNGDGTFSNPVMFGDYPDNDVIRVGDTYYMSSTSMHLFPGCPIMSSKDLVNWEYESYALPGDELLKIADNGGKKFTLESGNAYDKGAWATSLRYSERLKKFYLLVNIYDNGGYEYAALSVADSAKGPWTVYRLDNPKSAFNNPANAQFPSDALNPISGLYDPGLIFDKDPVTGEENGKIYVVHGQRCIYITELEVVDEETGELRIKDDPNTRNKPILAGKDSLEGMHGYKIGDTYYLLGTPVWKGVPNTTKNAYCVQTKDLLNGPYYAVDVISSTMNFGENGIHQGGIVDVPQQSGDSEWWSIIFQDRNKLGRVPTLQPVYWEEYETKPLNPTNCTVDENGEAQTLSWPMMGVQGKMGDQAVVTMEKPNTGATTSPSPVADSDEFNEPTLNLLWQWNHIADDTKWSLTENPGNMRLYTATVTDNLTYARNTLRQRVVGPESTATIKLNISNMADGDIAGLCVMQSNYNYIGVKCDESAGVKKLLINDGGSEIVSKELSGDTDVIWLRAHAPRFEYRVEYSYSLDGENFLPLGGRYDMHYGTYVGMGYGVFNFATKKLGGYVDLDFFHMDLPDNHGNYNAPNARIEAERYDNMSYDITRKSGNPALTRNENPLTDWTADYVYGTNYAKSGPTYDLAVHNMYDGDWLQYNRVDFGDGADWFDARVASTADGGSFEIRENTPDGKLLGTLEIPNTGNKEVYENVIVDLEDPSLTGVHQICLVYRGPNKSAYLNWFMFGSGAHPETPVAPELQVKADSEGTFLVTWDAEEGVDYDLRIGGGKIISNATSPYHHVSTGGDSISIRAKAPGGYSEWSEPVSAMLPNSIPREGMTGKASSEELVGRDERIYRILDGDPNTMWHTNWNEYTPPYWFEVDLGAEYTIDKITLLPRQDGGSNGRFQNYRLLYKSTTDGDWIVLQENGTLANDSSLKTIRFEPVTAREIRFENLNGIGNYASLAELNVFKVEEDLTPPTVPQNLKAENGEETWVRLSWDAATDEDGRVAHYKIYRDGSLLATVGNTTSYTDKTTADDTEYTYCVSAVNGGGTEGEKSDEVKITTAALAPVVERASISSLNTATVTFNKAMDRASMENAANYTVTEGVSITRAVAAQDCKSVTLYLDGMDDINSIRLTVGDVTDAAGNIAGGQKEFALTILLHYYKLDETEGDTFVDSGANKADGTKVGTITSAPGQVGNAISLVREGEYGGAIQVNDAAAAGQLNHSISAWINWNGVLLGSNTIIRSSDGSFWFHIRKQDGNDRKLWVDYPGGQVNSDSILVPEKQWVHVAFVSNEENGTSLYMNGELVGQSETPTPLLGGEKSFTISREQWQPFGGLIDEVKFFDFSLSDKDVAELAGIAHEHDYTVRGYDETNHWMECACGEVDAASVEAHTFDEGILNEDGTKVTYTCTVCGYEKTEDVAHEHDYTVRGYDETNHWMECACGEVDAASVEAHTFDEGILNEDGTKVTYTCTVCGYEKTEDVAHEHDYTVRGYDETNHWMECACGEVDAASVEAHTFDEGILNEDGTKVTYTCTVCGYEKTEDVAHEHDYTVRGYDETNHWMACACGEIDAESVAAHTFDEGVLNEDGTKLTYTCTVCGYAKDEAVEPSEPEVSPTPSYLIKATAGEGGTISPAGSIWTAMGVNKTFTIKADEGYVIADVLVDGVSVGAVSEYTFEKVSAKHTIEALFKVAEEGETEEELHRHAL